MPDAADGRELQDRLEDAEHRLAAIAEIASGEVDATGTAEIDLADAESRLNRIHDLASPSSQSREIVSAQTCLDHLPPLSVSRHPRVLPARSARSSWIPFATFPPSKWS